MPRHADPRVLLADVKYAAQGIMGYTEGMDYSVYANDSQIQAATERKFVIIGEAPNNLRKTCPEIAERIPELRDITGFRNLLVHAYDSVDPKRVWDYAA